METLLYFIAIIIVSFAIAFVISYIIASPIIVATASFEDTDIAYFSDDYCIKEKNEWYYVYQKVYLPPFYKYVETPFFSKDMEACFEYIEKRKKELQEEQKQPRTIYKTKRTKRK